MLKFTGVKKSLIVFGLLVSFFTINAKEQNPLLNVYNIDGMKHSFIDAEVEEKETLVQTLFSESCNETQTTVLQLFSHGEAGKLLLEGKWRSASEIAIWLRENYNLTNYHHINIYGCNFARGIIGENAVAYLEKELCVTVAASSNITGKDGDWELEFGNPVGAIAAVGYEGNLQICTKNIVLNPSFEDYTQCPDLSTWSTLDYANYWESPANTPQLMVYDPGVCESGAPASSWDPGSYLTGGHTGTNWGGGHTSEAWAVSMERKIPAGTYQVCFWAGWVSDKDNLTGVYHSPAPVKVDITNFTGTSVGTATSPVITNRLSSSNQTWVQYCVNITTTGDGYKIKFAPTGSNPSYIYMDDVSLMAPDPACPTSSPCSPWADTDGDEVINKNDLDDDNDGILDTQECTSYLPWAIYEYDRANNNRTGMPLKIEGSTTTNTTLDQNGYKYNGVFYDGKPFQLIASNIQPSSAGNITVTLTAAPTNTTGGYVLADAFMITNGVDTIVIDDSSPTGFSTIGFSASPGYATDYLNSSHSTVASASKKAIWSFTNLPKQTDGSCDTDNDGLSNTCDLDSDGDGCPDAYEAGVTALPNVIMQNGNVINGTPNTSTSTPNAVVAGPYDANGLANTVETGTETGLYKGSYTYSNAIDAGISNCPINTTVAENDINQTLANVPVSGNTLTNDTDLEGDGQTVQSATYLDASGNVQNLPLGVSTSIYDENNVLAGSIVLNSDGSYTFTPAADYTGVVPVEYVVVDDNGVPATDAATLTIEVLGEPNPASNNPPVAQDDTNTTEQDVNVGGDVISPNDFDIDGDVLTVVSILADTDGDGLVDEPISVGVATNVYGINESGDLVIAGQITLNGDGTYLFDPTPSFVGEVMVDYTIEDEEGLTDDATLTITIRSDVGNTTFANDDANIGYQGVEQTGNILDNDNDVEGNTQTVGSVTDSNGDPLVIDGTTANTLPSGGTLIINTDGSYTYTPDPDFIGTEVLVYEKCDNGTPQACETATLYLTTLPSPFIDFGDAPITYPSASHTGNLDTNQDNIPDPNGSVWFGSGVSFETTSKSSGDAQGDTFDDGMTVGTAAGNFPTTMLPSTTYNVALNLSSNGSATVYYGMWIDYDNDGTYDQFYSGSSAITAATSAVGSTTASVSITTPTTISATQLNIRLRADNAPLTSTSFEGALSGGEVEDYQVSVVLPVELLYFRGSGNGCDVELEWATASEEGNDYFVVEHSVDGRSFKLLEVVQGAGNSTDKLVYSTGHANVGRDLNYYRLKQVDFDGAFEYSKTISVKSDCKNGRSGVLGIYPNPTATGQVTVEVNVEAGLEAYLQVVDVLGRAVLSGHIMLPSGHSTHVLDLANVADGVYFVNVNGGGVVAATMRLVKVGE